MKKYLTLLLLFCLTIAMASAMGDKKPIVIQRALGDATALNATVMTNIPLGAAGYMGVLNSADGIQEGGLVRNAVYFNAEIAKRFKGRKAKSITTAIYWQGVQEAKIWIRKSLDGPDLWSKTCIPDEFGRLVDPDASEIIYGEDGSSTVIDYESPIDIPCDYILDGEPIYVGHDLQLRQEYGGIHAYVCSPAYTEGHWYFCPDEMSEWQDFTGNGAYIMELQTAATEGCAAGLQMNDVSVTNIISTRAKAGETATVEAMFGNYGRNKVTTVEFEYEIDGKTGTFSIDAGTNAMPYGAVVPVTFDVKMPEEAKLYDLTLRVKKVNGVEDTFTDGNEFTGIAVVLNNANDSKRVVVMENFASLYQSDEPYAIRSIEELQKEYGDQFILIDAHYGQTGLPDNWWTYDPWHCQDYAAQREAMFKIPNCYVNRTFEGDPFYGSEADFLAGKNGIRTVVSNIATQPAEAIVGGHANISEDKLSIDVATEVTFLSEINDISHYTVGYVVTEDRLVGKQRNIYAGNYECFKWFKELGLPDLPFWWERTFNDVAREGSLRRGVPGLLRGSVAADETYNCRFSVPMPKDYENAQNLHVVILLMEQGSGEIMAAKKIGIDNATAIKNVDSDFNVNSNFNYNLNGQRVNSNHKGIVIRNGKAFINTKH